MIPFKAAGILDCPLQRLDRIFLSFHPVPFFLHFTLSVISSAFTELCVLIHSHTEEYLTETKTHNTIWYPRVNNQISPLAVPSQQYLCDYDFFSCFLWLYKILSNCTRNHYTHLLTKTHNTDEKNREKYKTLSQRGNKNKKINLKVDLIPSGNSKETDTGGIWMRRVCVWVGGWVGGVCVHVHWWDEARGKWLVVPRSMGKGTQWKERK